jgi:hypothetical protein
MITAHAFLCRYLAVGTLHRIALEPFAVLFLFLPDTRHSLQVDFATESLLHVRSVRGSPRDGRGILARAAW